MLTRSSKQAKPVANTAGAPSATGAHACTSDDGARQNPLAKIAAAAADAMVRYVSEFGLTPVGRARIAAGRASLIACSLDPGQ
jgi:phage terminase small subunit